MSRLRVGGTVAVALAVAMLLSACLPFSPFDEIGSGLDKSVDTESIAEAVTATSDSISSTIVETSRDGFNTRLYVVPIITTDGLTSDELSAVLEVAYLESRDQVQAIEVRTKDALDEPIGLGEAASGLGILYTQEINSVTYSTVHLEEAYGE